jgi:hypothetical protein
MGEEIGEEQGQRRHRAQSADSGPRDPESKGGPYHAPDPKHMHEMKRAKLIRHHSKRLRDLGADDELIGAMVAKLISQPAVCSSATEKQTEADAPTPLIRRVSPAKVCRGALGFRARQTRPQVYPVVKERAAGAPSQGRTTSKRAKPTKGKKRGVRL